jgi:hypothetical protein
MASPGLMKWQSVGLSGEEKVLHLLPPGATSWLPYTSLPQYARPDYGVHRGSKGFATMQSLLKQGWEYC